LGFFDWLATSGTAIHHRDMLRQFGILLLLISSASAGVVEDVQSSLMQGDFTTAESELKSYQAKLGVTPEYLEALSWMGRAALQKQQYSQAENYAKQTLASALPLLQRRKMDAEPHLPIAVGAAIEVQALSLAGRGQKAQGVALLRRSLQTYGNTSIAARLHKNLNLLNFVGQSAPPLKSAEYLDSKPLTATQLKGSPQLLFFWAHWCADCKGEAPILARLRSEFSELTFIAPTQRYGYGARGDDVTPQAERAYIEKVWQQYYPGLRGVSVPVSKENFNVYGASTTPTLVLVDRTGKIAFYHPGALSYEDLRAAIQKIIGG
jgi:cytochrome c biogenesis protein CcmG/thiol:disulfide interchange protein DsbE